MKKLLFIAATVCTFTACSDDKKTEPTPVTPTDTSSAMAAEALQTDAAALASAPKTADGDITMEDGKMMIMQAGAWVAMDKAVTLANGTTVMLSGDLKMKDHTMKMPEGGMIKTNGDFMDKDGNMLMSGAGMHSDKMSDTTHKM